MAFLTFAMVVGCTALLGPVGWFVAGQSSPNGRAAGAAAQSPLPHGAVASPVAPRATVGPVPLATAIGPATGPPALGGHAAAQAGTLVAGHFGLGLLIADRGNGRLLIVSQAGRTLWRFPVHGSLPRGQAFSADDAFIAPDGRTIVANDEAHQVIDRIDIVSHKVVWQYGHYARAGSAHGYLHTPDDAYPLANGNVTVADIRNCRILEISPGKRIVRQWGTAGRCTNHSAHSFNNPNGDTPLGDGGMLITTIGGSRVIRLSASGHVRFDVHVPAAYPSDAQLDPRGNVLVVDYSTIGSILRVSSHGRVLWRYRVASGRGRLDHPSLAVVLPDGTIAVNDDFRHRVLVIDPATRRIVWQYGHTDRPGRSAGYLFVPDGIDPIPFGTQL